jgi:hypothetical protein
MREVPRRPGGGPAPRPTRTRRRVAALAGALIVAILIGGYVYFFVRWPRGDPPPRIVPASPPRGSLIAPVPGAQNWKLSPASKRWSSRRTFSGGVELRS